MHITMEQPGAKELLITLLHKNRAQYHIEFHEYLANHLTYDFMFPLANLHLACPWFLYTKWELLLTECNNSMTTT
jgi:hypothetical protein